LEQNRLKLDKAIEQTIARFMPLRHETYVKLRDRLESLERAYQDNPSSSATTEGLEPTTSTSPSVTSPDSQSASLGGSLETLLAQTRDELNNLIEQGKEQLQWLHSDEVMKLSGEQQMQTEEVLFVRDVWPFVFEKDKVRKVNAELEGSIDSALETLRRKIEGKIVLLGCTASDLGDFVPTPVFERCPGVLVHANVINQILQRSFFTHSQRNTDMLVILAMGMLVSLITTQRSAMEALGWMLVLLTGFFLVNCYLLFEKLHVISLLVGPMIAVFLSWSGVTLYRQITEGRAKRQFASRLSQYTSPALARQITENPGSLVLTPEQREVSCFFSDLAGFTPMSEQLGAQQTVRLLNVYLEHMSECLDDYEAFINKFQGDGIFAFFNPPLHPQVDHARRACLAALACQEHLPHVQEHLEEQEFSLPSPLKMRIGISTGAVVVGDCGSTRKFDYTCLGDTVNLASRLETANKFFATKIMIDEATYRQMGDDLTARVLGKIRVVGREQSVVVYELIGRREDQIERMAFITGFEKLILAYWRRDFSEMRACLKTLQEMPAGQDDQPLRIYQTLLNRIETEGDDIYRDGVIEMETK
jgi:adenylate cyclase